MVVAQVAEDPVDLAPAAVIVPVLLVPATQVAVELDQVAASEEAASEAEDIITHHPRDTTMAATDRTIIPQFTLVVEPG